MSKARRAPGARRSPGTSEMLETRRAPVSNGGVKTLEKSCERVVGNLSYRG